MALNRYRKKAYLEQFLIFIYYYCEYWQNKFQFLKILSLPNFIRNLIKQAQDKGYLMLKSTMLVDSWSKLHFISYRKILIFLITFALMLAQNNSKSLALEDMVVTVKKETIETNFVNIDATTYTSASWNEKLVIAGSGKDLYLSNRKSNTVSHYFKINDGLFHVEDFVIPKKNDALIYVLDIEPFNNTFLVSVVEYFVEPKSCSTMKLYQYYDNQNFKLRFVSKPCLGGIGEWSEIAGRIAVDEKNNIVYLTGGNVLTDLYRNQFPRPGICCMTGSYKEIMKNTNLFGSVVAISLLTNKSFKVSVGHRGPQGIEFDELSSIVYETEHGPRGGDEINIIKRNRDYGWPFVTFGREYYPEFNLPDSGFGKSLKTNTHAGYTEPIFSWVPAIGVSQLILVRKKSNFFKYWPTDLLVTTLKDNSIRRLHVADKGTKIMYDEKINIGKRIRDIEPLDGGFVISTDDNLIIYLDVSETTIGGGPFPPVR